MSIGTVDLLVNAGAGSGVDITGEWMTWFGGPGDFWVWGELAGGGCYLEAAFAYKEDDFSFTVNGESVVTDVLGSVPTGMTTFSIGYAGGFGFFLNGNLPKLTYYPTRLPNETLVALST